MTDVRERLRSALERVLGEPVKALPRQVWLNSLRPGGLPTRLPRPFDPYGAVAQRAEFMTCVASGMGYTSSRGGDAGFHIVRLDEKDAPNYINTDSYTLIEEPAGHARWPEVLKVAGVDAGPDVDAVLRDWVFAFGPGRRIDHHSPVVPPDIAGAEPK